jgi:hypothetical protein
VVIGQTLEVCEVILNGKTVAYINESDANYKNYITIVNMPFLRGKLEWGTSIRGAWFDESRSDYFYPHEKAGELKTYNFCNGNLEVPRTEIKQFIQELIEWTYEGNE